jgi:hypothetical protein
MKVNRSLFKAIRALKKAGAIDSINDLAYWARKGKIAEFGMYSRKAWSIILDSRLYDYTQVTLQRIKGNFSLIILQSSKEDNHLQVIPLTNFDIDEPRHIAYDIEMRAVYEGGRHSYYESRRWAL